MDFAKAPLSTEELFVLISRVPSGREVLERFLPLHQKGRVKIEGYPAHVVERLRAVLGEGQPIGACFLNDGDQGTIYLDLASPIGVLAPFLLHEMVHSLDASLWVAGRQGLKGAERDRLMLETETEAFGTQHRFSQELGERFPDYRKFLKAQYPRAKILNDLLTSQDISELYGFKIA